MLKIRFAKNSIINLLFDLSFLMYIVAYIYYYDDSITNSSTIRLVATLAILLFGTIEVLLNYKKVYLNNYIIVYTLFMLFCVLSSLWALDSKMALSSLPIMIRIVLFFVFINYRIIEDADIERLLDVFLIAIIIVVIIVANDMIAYYSRSSFLLYRFGIVGNNPNTIAMISVFGTVICNHKCKIDDRKKLHIVLMIFYILIILVTQSKKGILSFALGIYLLSFYRNKGARRYNKVFYLGIIMLILYIALMMIPFLYNNVGCRFDELFDLLGSKSTGLNSTTARAELISEGFKMWLHQPLLGIGNNNFGLVQTVHANSYYYSHCNYIELLSGVGLVGFFLFYFLPFRVFRITIEINDDLRIALKTICLLMLFMDIAAVTFQTVYLLVFYNFFYISINR